MATVSLSLFVGCGPRIVEYSLDSPLLDSEGTLSGNGLTNALIARTVTSPESSADESSADESTSTSGYPSPLGPGTIASNHRAVEETTSPFFIVPEEVSGRTIGKLLLQRGQSKRDALLKLAATRILASSSPGRSERQVARWNEHLDEVEMLAKDDQLIRTLSLLVRSVLQSERAKSPSENGSWKVGIYRFTDVGLGEMVAKYGEDTDDPLSHLAGLALLAVATRQSGVPPASELNARVEKFLNTGKLSIWIALADRVTEIIDQRAIREMQQRPGQDWDRFLGPLSDGQSQETELIKQWPDDGPPVTWQFETGRGFGTCSIQGGKLYLFDRAGDYNRLVCLDQETGEVLGETFAYAAETKSPGGYRGPRCSPVIDDDRIYVVDEAGLLHCLRAGTNEVLWKSDTTGEFCVTENRFGVSATPIVVDDLLIMIVGGGMADGSKRSSTREPEPNGSALVAFEKETGKVVYASGNYLGDYASPVTTEVDGVTWGLAFLREGLVGFAPNTGQVLSHFSWRSQDLTSVNAASPVVNGNEVFVSNAFGQGSALLRLEPSGFTPVWKDDPESAEKRFEAYFSTPVFHDGFLYGCSGKNSHSAELRCIDWRTGEVMWSEKGLNRSSLILVDGQLICLTEYGDLLLIEATPEAYRLVSKATLPRVSDERLPPEIRVPGLLEYPCWAAPVLSRGFLYLRSPNKLVCLDLLATKRQPLPVMVDENTKDADESVAGETQPTAPGETTTEIVDLADGSKPESASSVVEETIEGDQTVAEVEPVPEDSSATTDLGGDVRDSEEDNTEVVRDEAEAESEAEQPGPEEVSTPDARPGSHAEPNTNDHNVGSEPNATKDPSPSSSAATTAGASDRVEGDNQNQVVQDDHPSATPAEPSEARVASKQPGVLQPHVVPGLNATEDANDNPASSEDSAQALQPGLLVEFRMWTNATGTTRYFAVVSATEDQVLFLAQDGVERSYPLAKLSQSDQELIAKSIETRRAARDRAASDDASSDDASSDDASSDDAAGDDAASDDAAGDDAAPRESTREE